MPSHLGFQVQILVNGVIAEEHQAKLEGNTMTCYIVSEPSATFAIQSTNNPSSGAVHYYYLDGHYLTGAVFDAGSRPPVRIVSTVQTSASTIASFQFSDISVSDEPDALPSAGSSKTDVTKLGSIHVKVYRGSKGAEIPTTFGSSLTDLKGSSTLNEKVVKKGKLTQRAGLGAETAGAIGSHSVQFHKTDIRPVAEFIFLYRSKSMLQALEVVKFSPKPEAAAAPDVKSNVNMTASGLKRGANEIIELSSDEEDSVKPKNFGQFKIPKMENNKENPIEL